MSWTKRHILEPLLEEANYRNTNRILYPDMPDEHFNEPEPEPQTAEEYLAFISPIHEIENNENIWATLFIILDSYTFLIY